MPRLEINDAKNAGSVPASSYSYDFLMKEEKKKKGDFTVYGGRDERQNEKEDRYQSRQPSYPQVLASFESGNLKTTIQNGKNIIILISFFWENQIMNQIFEKKTNKTTTIHGRIRRAGYPFQKTSI